MLCGKHRYRLRHRGSVDWKPPLPPFAQWLYDRKDMPDTGECLVHPFPRNAGGYATASYDGESITAHRLMCFFAHGAPPAWARDWHAAHSCGMGHEGCVHPKHLRWRTAAQNAEDRREHERLKLGRFAIT